MRANGKIPYDEIDANLHNLIQELNALPALRTIGSCGGHENASRGQWDAGTWYVKFDLDKDVLGWVTLEFLAWAINSDYAGLGKHNVSFHPTAPPPYLNKPFFGLHFVIEGYGGEDPEELADRLAKFHEVYVYPDTEAVEKYYSEEILMSER